MSCTKEYPKTMFTLLILLTIFILWPWAVLIVNIIEYMVNLDYINLTEPQMLLYAVWPLIWTLIICLFTPYSKRI